MFLFLLICFGDRHSHKRCSIKKLSLKISQISLEKTHIFESLFNKVVGLKVCSFIKQETPPQLFSCEYCKILKNRFCRKHLWCLLLKMVEEFLKNSNLTRGIHTEEFIRNSGLCFNNLKKGFTEEVLRNSR